MRTGFIVILLALIAMSIGAVMTIPPRDTGGRKTLVWVTDANPARKSQIALFEQFDPALTAVVDAGNLTTSKVIVQSSGGHGPDVVDCYGANQTDTYARTGIAWDITDRAEQLGISPDQVWPGLRNLMKWNGRQYAFPTNCGPMGYFYNKDIFDELGLSYPTADWTWQEFLDLAKTIQQRRKESRRWFVLNHYWYMDAIWQAGGSFYSKDGSRCTLNSPQAKQAWRFWNDLREKWNIVPDAVELEGMASASQSYGGGHPGMFLAGRFVFFRSGRWAQITWRQANEERAKHGQAPFRYGVAPLPHLRVKASRLAARATAINQHGPRRELGLRFLEFLASEPYCNDINMTADGVSAVMNYAQSVEQITNPDYPDERECDEVWLRELPYGRGFETSPFIIPADADRIVEQYKSAITLGSMTPEAAADVMAAEINAKIMENVRQFRHLREQYESLTTDGAANESGRN